MDNVLRKIDETLILEHRFLSVPDECYFLMDYTPGQGFEYSKANSMITNFKKSVYRLPRYEWSYKDQAINEISELFRTALDEEYIQEWTLVPIPTSKCKEDRRYDDRMPEVLKRLGKNSSADIRELIYTIESTSCSHLSPETRNPKVYKSNFALEERLCNPLPSRILLFDDVITSGAHYIACKELLLERFPEAVLKGIFVARRALQQE